MWIDGHCHPIDHPETLDSIESMDLKMIAMSSRPKDGQLMAQTADRFPHRVVPAFGLHPWYSYLVSVNPGPVDKTAHYKSVLQPIPNDDDPVLELLPNPLPLSEYLSELHHWLTAYPNAFVGEIGLDRPFRLKIGDKLYSFRVAMAHQRAILRAQLAVANEFQRPVSLHGVNAHQPLFEEVADALKGAEGHHLRAVCLHSYGGSAEFYTQCWSTLGIDVYLSMAPFIGDRMAESRLQTMLAAADPRLVLSESDWSSAGAEQLANVKRSVEILRSRFHWSEDEAHAILQSNFDALCSTTMSATHSTLEI